MGKRFYRNPDGKMIGGVCSGIATYFKISVVIVRVLFVIALIVWTSGLWVYLAICLIAPLAKTPREKCELRGMPATPENMSRFSSAHSGRPHGKGSHE